jgi:hypothetical protein
MRRLSRRQQVSLAAAPLFSAAALLMGYRHSFGTDDRADALLGVIVGVGVGISLTALMTFRRGRGAR